MKLISKQYLLYLSTVVIYTLVFRIFLSHFISNYSPVMILIVAVAYGALMFITAFYLGKSDGISNGFFDIGLRWHLGTMILWTLVSLAWLYFGNKAESEHPVQVYHTLLIWSFFAIAHIIVFLVVRRKTIKGIHKSEIFE